LRCRFSTTCRNDDDALNVFSPREDEAEASACIRIVSEKEEEKEDGKTSLRETRIKVCETVVRIATVEDSFRMRYNDNNNNNNSNNSNNSSSNNKEEEEGRAPPPRLPSRTATRPRVSVSSKLLPPLDFSRPPRTASGPDAFAARPKRRFRLPTRPLSSTATGTIYTQFWKTRLYSNA